LAFFSFALYFTAGHGGFLSPGASESYIFGLTRPRAGLLCTEAAS